MLRVPRFLAGVASGRALSAAVGMRYIWSDCTASRANIGTVVVAAARTPIDRHRGCEEAQTSSRLPFTLTIDCAARRAANLSSVPNLAITVGLGVIMTTLPWAGAVAAPPGEPLPW